MGAGGGTFFKTHSGLTAVGTESRQMGLITPLCRHQSIVKVAKLVFSSIFSTLGGRGGDISRRGGDISGKNCDFEKNSIHRTKLLKFCLGYNRLPSSWFISLNVNKLMWKNRGGEHQRRTNLRFSCLKNHCIKFVGCFDIEIGQNLPTPV